MESMQDLAKLAVILTAAENKNTIPHARRLARIKYGLDINLVDLEAAAAELAAESLRQLAAVTKGGDRG